MILWFNKNIGDHDHCNLSTILLCYVKKFSLIYCSKKKFYATNIKSKFP